MLMTMRSLTHITLSLGLTFTTLLGCAYDPTPGASIGQVAGPDDPTTSTTAPADTPAAPGETPAEPVDTPAQPVDTPAEPIDTPVDTPAEPVDTPGTAPTVACDAWPEAPTWTVPDPSGPLFGAVSMTISPNAGLLMGSGEFGGTVHRTADGLMLGGHPLVAGTVDDAWALSARPVEHEERVALFALKSGVEIASLPVPATPDPEKDWLSALSATLTPQGHRAIAGACWRAVGQDPGDLVITTWSVTTQQPISSTVLPGICDDHMSWPRRPMLIATPDGDAVIATPGMGRILHVDLLTGAATATKIDVAATTPINSDWAPYGMKPVMTTALSPTGDELAIVTHAGQVQRFALPSLLPLGTPIMAGLAVVNQHTYIPSVESPLAYSPDGTLLAFIDGEGEPNLLETATGELVKTFHRPLLEEATPWSGPTDGYLSGLKFGADGQTLFASGEAGLSAWRCDETEVPPMQGAEAPIFLGPTAVVVGQEAVYSIHAPAFTDATVFSLVVDDEPVRYVASFGTQIRFTSWEEGEHTVALLADDGAKTAISAPITVTVLPAP